MFSYFLIFISYLILTAKRMFETIRRNSDSVDRISELPDDVFRIIISHLKTEDAVRTSVLSSRWKHLWKSSTCFNFVAYFLIQEVIDGKIGNYISWMNQVVDNHEGSYLDELVIVIHLDATHAQYLDKWISFAVSKRAKTIKLELLPYCFYRNDRANEKYSFIKTVPALSGIECLRSLCLNYVNVTGELIEQLLSVCPLLEWLSLARSQNLENLKVIGATLKLKHFEIEYCYRFKSIEIFAPNLVSFRCNHTKLLQRLLLVENLSCLVDLYITQSNYYVFLQFSNYFSRLKTLTLRCHLTERLLESLEHSQFTNLKHLTFIDSAFEQDNMQCLPEFISLCPVLHTLKLDSFANTSEEIKWRERRLDSLKEVELSRFKGRDDDIKIAMFFLKNAIRLKKFIISLKAGWTKEERLRISELLETKVPQGVELLF